MHLFSECPQTHYKLLQNVLPKDTKEGVMYSVFRSVSLWVKHYTVEGTGYISELSQETSTGYAQPRKLKITNRRIGRTFQI